MEQKSKYEAVVGVMWAQKDIETLNEEIQDLLVEFLDEARDLDEETIALFNEYREKRRALFEERDSWGDVLNDNELFWAVIKGC